MGSSWRGPFIVFVFAIIGFIMALIEQMAYDNSYILNQYITSASMLQGLEIITIVVALLVGSVIAAASN